MVDTEERSGASESTDDAAPRPRRIPDRTGGSAETEMPRGTAISATRPVQVRGNYPVREVTWYQFNSSDIRSIGVAQAAATIFAALGTFALSNYIDFSKDITLAEQDGRDVPQFLYNIADLSFWAWIIFWAVAIVAFLWQGNELMRIKAEHKVPTWLNKIRNWWNSRGSR
ncbi:MAG: hypothetical protein MN733_37565 [Nitrososphaera sp.]|nr:hypothetical protein [Nitrososphaera sp.]